MNVIFIQCIEKIVNELPTVFKLNAFHRAIKTALKGVAHQRVFIIPGKGRALYFPVEAVMGTPSGFLRVNDDGIRTFDEETADDAVLGCIFMDP